ncbi:MAG TPA: hypothetical protein VFF64_20615 [Candidatus Eremiobacteraceae bacterium]|nr:hypothetical protein [Candidatus Eremiobacteraceae bacterium]
MFVAVTFAAIALTGTAFMVWFLLALLLDNAPSTCCWIVPIRHERERECVEALRSSDVDEDYHTCGRNYCNSYVELLENEDHAKEHTSALISIDVRPTPGGVGWRSIHPIHRAIFQHRL